MMTIHYEVGSLERWKSMDFWSRRPNSARRTRNSQKPSMAVVDLRLEDGNGLDVVKELSKNKSDIEL